MEELPLAKPKTLVAIESTSEVVAESASLLKMSTSQYWSKQRQRSRPRRVILWSGHEVGVKPKVKKQKTATESIVAVAKPNAKPSVCQETKEACRQSTYDELLAKVQEEANYVVIEISKNSLKNNKLRICLNRLETWEGIAS